VQAPLVARLPALRLSAVPRSQHGFASGILATSRTVGRGIGVALAGAIWANNVGYSVAAATALITAVICAIARPSPDEERSREQGRGVGG
jgi:hypothetical protein